MNEVRLPGTISAFSSLESRLSDILGAFLRVARELLGATLISNGTNYTSTSSIHTAELRNPESGAAFYVLRHNDTTYDPDVCVLVLGGILTP